MTIHYRAEGRQEYQALTFVPGSRPFDLFDQDRHGRVKLYVRRVFITDEAELVPRYLRFVRGPLLASIKKGVTGRILGDLAKLAENDSEAYAKIWENFGIVLKEGIYEDFDRREQLLKLARFRSTSSAEGLRSLADYVAAMKEGQTAIFYMARRRSRQAGSLAATRRFPGARGRGYSAHRSSRQLLGNGRSAV